MGDSVRANHRESDASQAPDAVELLARDHVEVRQLFDRLQRPDEDRKAVLRDLLRRIAAHVAVERSVLYPVLKAGEPEAARLGDGLREDHDEIERLLVLIERRKPNSPDVPALATELRDVVLAHETAANERLFPRMRADLSPEELCELGSRMSYDEGLVLSHPHPHLLSLGPLNRILLPLAGFFDRLRDRTVTNN
jgi:hemerythrin superfamily protein